MLIEIRCGLEKNSALSSNLLQSFKIDEGIYHTLKLYDQINIVSFVINPWTAHEMI